MFLSAPLSIAKGRVTFVWFDITLTQVMPSPLETFASMHEFVGEWKTWLQLMKPEMLMPLVKHWKRSRIYRGF